MVSMPATAASSIDRSVPTLEFLHHLLLAGDDSPVETTLVDILGRLVETFGAMRAGLHLMPQLTPVAVTGTAPLEGLPWESAPSVLERARNSAAAIAVPEPGVGDGGFLLTVLRAPAGAWLLWLQDADRSEWPAADCAAWALAGSVLLRWLETSAGPRWAEQLDRALRQDRMENANLAVRRLAHDFGNVFTSLLGFSELSLSQHLPANSPLHRYLVELHQSAQDGAKLTHRLRVQSRRQAHSVRGTPMVTLLQNEEARLRPLLPEGAELILDVAGELPNGAIDGTHMLMVLSELLNNAREAIAQVTEGPGTIRVTARSGYLSREDCLDFYGYPRPGPALELRIEDNGPGFSELARQRIFREPFFSTRTRKGGFGLTTVYGILAAHQGGMQFIETPGQPGLTVRVVVPPGPTGRSNQGVALNPLAATNARAIRNERILVVDDDPRILGLARTTLEGAGYRVQVASSAREARSRIDTERNEPFHLILTDVTMPEETGVDLVEGLLEREPQVRFLFMSGQTGNRRVARLESGRDRIGLLPKPFVPDGLLRAVREALDLKPYGPPARNSTRDPVSKK